VKRGGALERRTPLRTKTPIRRKRTTPRRTAARPRAERPESERCSVRGCKKLPRWTISPTERYCDGHGTQKADDACRVFVKARDPICVACGRDDIGVQWAHVHTRGMRYVRWDALNSVGLCARCHYAYTKAPAKWIKFVERTWPGRFVRILHRELFAEQSGGHVDVVAVIRTYRAGEPWAMPDPPETWRSSSVEETGLTSAEA
jgi:hypothetical protein